MPHPSFMSRLRRTIEALLVVTGAVSLVAYGWFTIETWRLESENRSVVSRLLNEPIAVSEAPDLTPSSANSISRGCTSRLPCGREMIRMY
jgi:hypothetical protein